MAAPDVPYYFPARHTRSIDVSSLSEDLDLTAISGCPQFGPTRVYAYVDSGGSATEPITLFMSESGASVTTAFSLNSNASDIPVVITISQEVLGIDESGSGNNIQVICEWRYHGSYTLNP